MSPIPTLVATSIALTCLIAARGLAHSAALRQITPAAGDLARLLIGIVLLACATAAMAWLINPALPRILIGLTGLVSASLGGFVLLRHRHARNAHAAMGWLTILAAIVVVAPIAVADDAQGLLIAGLVTAFVLAIGLPAFAVLAKRLDDSDLPACMRALPAPVLATGIVALSLAGSVSW